jgi:hypothetical protein
MSYWFEEALTLVLRLPGLIYAIRGSVIDCAQTGSAFAECASGRPCVWQYELKCC